MHVLNCVFKQAVVVVVAVVVTVLVAAMVVMRHAHRHICMCVLCVCVCVSGRPLPRQCSAADSTVMARRVWPGIGHVAAFGPGVPLIRTS